MKICKILPNCRKCKDAFAPWEESLPCHMCVDKNVQYELLAVGGGGFLKPAWAIVVREGLGDPIKVRLSRYMEYGPLQMDILMNGEEVWDAYFNHFAE